MKTLIIQSYRTHNVPTWIARCLATVRDWAAAKGHDYRLTDDGAFALCGEEYLAQVGGENMRSITNLCRLELIKAALAEGYERAIWLDADIQVFAPDRLHIPHGPRIAFARETWLQPIEGGWSVNETLNNAVIACPRGDPDLDLIITATRHRARHHHNGNNFLLGVELIRGLSRFLHFPMLDNVGMFSSFVVMAIAQNQETLLRHQAQQHGAPVFAANLCASEHIKPAVPEAYAMLAMNILERTGGDVINAHLPGWGAAAG